MAKMDDYMAGKLDPNDPWVVYGRQQGWLPERSSLEAAMPVAQAPERKRSWGGKPVDTMNFIPAQGD